MDLYAALGLTPTADQAAIRTAYRSLAKQYHPDVSTLPDAHARFLAIAEAYQVLSDPATRARYDRTRQHAAARQARPQRPAPASGSTSPRTRYDRTYSKHRREARARAEAHSRMPYEEFNAYAFDTVAGYVGPKILGCVGFALIGIVVMSGLIWLFHEIEWLMFAIAMFALFGFLPAMAYASTKFDWWHNRRQVERKRGRR